MKNILPILVILFFSFSIKTTAQSAQKTINRIDLLVIEDKTNLSEQDKLTIANYNFDSYRFMNLHKKIQLVNGPLIELLSIKELQSLGITVPQDVINTAQEKSESFKHESILLLSIGLGIIHLSNPN